MPSILIVEDDLSFAGSARAHLTRAGFEVEIAIDTLSALHMVEARPFDMLLVGVGVGKPSGGLSGLDFAHMVRWRQPRSHVIFVTGHPELTAAVPRFSGKVFTRPVALDDIVSEIRSQLAE